MTSLEELDKLRDVLETERERLRKEYEAERTKVTIEFILQTFPDIDKARHLVVDRVERGKVSVGYPRKRKDALIALSSSLWNYHDELKMWRVVTDEHLWLFRDSEFEKGYRIRKATSAEMKEAREYGRLDEDEDEWVDA